MIRNLVRTFQRFFRRRNHPGWAELETVLGLRIYNFPLFKKALRHPSSEQSRQQGPLESYERLEFLGDAILGAVIAEYLYREFPEELEGFLSATRSKLVSGEACAQVAREIGLWEFVELDANMQSRGVRKNSSVLADCLESVIGAIYLDSGITSSRNFIHQKVLKRVDLPELVASDHNYKSRLQELVQSRKWDQPEYRVADVDGPPHHSMFTIDVYVNGKRKGRGKAPSKKKAEQHAARQALSSFAASGSSAQNQ